MRHNGSNLSGILLNDVNLPKFLKLLLILVIRYFNEGIFFGDSSGDFEEETVDQLHDVGLVNNGDFLSSTQVGELKGVLNESFRVGSGGDLEGFHDSWVNFVFDSGEFSFSVFSDDGNVDVVMLVGDGWERVAKVDIGVKIEMFVEFVVVVVLGDDTFFGDHDTHEDAFIFLEEGSVGGILKGEILEDVELNRNVGGFEDIKDRV